MSNQVNDEGLTAAIMLGVSTVLIGGGIAGLVYFNKPKCTHCKKRRKHTEVAREVINETNTKISKTDKTEIEDEAGNILRTENRHYTVPGVIITYRITFLCKHCNKEFDIIDKEKIEVINRR
jgi:hypothetical protein